MTNKVMESLTVDTTGTTLATLRDANGNQQRAVWNPGRRVQFAIPVEWNVTRQHELTGAMLDLTGQPSVAIGESPVLLERQVQLNARPHTPAKFRVIP